VFERVNPGVEREREKSNRNRNEILFLFLFYIIIVIGAFRHTHIVGMPNSDGEQGSKKKKTGALYCATRRPQMLK
jgi:hypothetical protein